MANTKISALPAGTALAGTEPFPAVQSAATVKITAAQIKTFTSASPTLVTPDLGTPSAGVLTNATGLPPSTGLSTFVAPLKGGLGAALVPVIGDLLYADSTTSFARLAAVAVGRVLVSGGTGTAPAWSNTPALTSLALGGATIGSNALAVTGTNLFNGATSIPVGAVGTPSIFFAGSSTTGFYKTTGNDSVSITSAGAAKIALGTSNANVPAVMLSNDTGIGWSVNSSADSLTPDLFIRRSAAATLQHGAADSASPVAQTIKFQDVVAGTSNTAGVNATIQASAGTGTGAGGSLIFQVAAAGSSGTAKNAQATALTIDSTKKVTLAGDLQLSNAYVATPQVPTGYITIYDSTGTAYKVSVNV